MDVAMTLEKPSAPQMPIPVQILSTLVFGGFAITSVVMAFIHFWPAGVAVALVLGWRGGFGPQNFTQVSADEIVAKLKSVSPEAELRSSGNSSFDAYRRDMMARLEEEQDQFDTFLRRLRDAKSQSEFEQFMDDRANRATLTKD